MNTNLIFSKKRRYVHYCTSKRGRWKDLCHPGDSTYGCMKRTLHQSSLASQEEDGVPDGMETCGTRCKARYREFLKPVSVEIGNIKLKYTGMNSFSGFKKKYERQKEVVLSNRETFRNSHMLKDTGAVIC